MEGYIGNKNFVDMEAMRYWQFPLSYKKDKKQETHDLIFSGRYVGALKRDGYYQRVIKDEDGNIFMVARDKNVKGEPVDKHEWVPQLKNWFESLPNGTCLIGEIYLPNDEGSRKITSLLGCLKEKCIARQQEQNKFLHFYVFDVCAWKGESYMSIPIEDRIRVLNEIGSSIYGNYPYVDFATYYEGAELWDKISEYLANGLEGVVITRKDCPIYEKRTPARMTIKIKKEMSNTIDCFFTGRASAPTKAYTGKQIEEWMYWENTRTGEKFNERLWKKYDEGTTSLMPITKNYYYGWAGSLEIGVIKDEKITPIGWLSGLTEEIKANYKNYKGKVIEITSMERFDTDAGGLRHAKMVGFREDKQWQDCSWDQLK